MEALFSCEIELFDNDDINVSKIMLSHLNYAEYFFSITELYTLHLHNPLSWRYWIWMDPEDTKALRVKQEIECSHSQYQSTQMPCHPPLALAETIRGGDFHLT